MYVWLVSNVCVTYCITLTKGLVENWYSQKKILYTATTELIKHRIVKNRYSRGRNNPSGHNYWKMWASASYYICMYHYLVFSRLQGHSKIIIFQNTLGTTVTVNSWQERPWVQIPTTFFKSHWDTWMQVLRTNTVQYKCQTILTASPLSLLTTRFSSMSHLLPRIIFSTSSLACCNVLNLISYQYI